MHTDTTGRESSAAARQRVSDDSLKSAAGILDGSQTVLQQAAVSPSLRPWVRGQSPAFEMKFLVDESQARDVETRLATRLSLDPHSDRELGNAYRVTTVYCDTPDRQVF